MHQVPPVERREIERADARAIAEGRQTRGRGLTHRRGAVEREQRGVRMRVQQRRRRARRRPLRARRCGTCRRTRTARATGSSSSSRGVAGRRSRRCPRNRRRVVFSPLGHGAQTGGPRSTTASCEEDANRFRIDPMLFDRGSARTACPPCRRRGRARRPGGRSGRHRART